MKRYLTVAVLLAFLIGIAGMGFAAQESYRGTVAKIDGSKITVKDENGVDRVVTGDVSTLKKGDKVTVKGGKAVRSGAPATSPRLDPQPEPPKPDGKLSPKVSRQLNPQPEPPMSDGKLSPKAGPQLNPQPEPPLPTGKVNPDVKR